MNNFKFFLITLTFGSAAFAETYPSIICYNILNASYALTIKTIRILPNGSNGKKVYFSNVKALSGSRVESSEFGNLEVNGFSSGRRSGFEYSIKLQNSKETLLRSTCLYGADICSSPQFVGKITEAAGAVNNLTCKFE